MHFRRALAAALVAAVLLPVVARGATPAGDSALVKVFVVRHAEKDTAVKGDASPLTARGQERARTLARLLHDAGITRVFSTPTRRTMDTAAPVAAIDSVRLVLVGRTPDLVQSLRELPWGERVLVVGHSNTVPEIVSQLSGRPPVPIPDAEHDRLYIVTLRRGGPPDVVLLRYGEPPDPGAPAHGTMSR
jgi:broad specificity phosphatase PhoE